MKPARILPRLAVAAVILFAGAQFIRPALKNPPHKKLLVGAAMPANVRSILERACQDCHSNNTNWPWYARTAPVSWMVTKDVKRGRAFLNLSEWETYNRSQQFGFLASIAGATGNRSMPPRPYVFLHPAARLSNGERRMIADWAKGEYLRLRAAAK